MTPMKVDVLIAQFCYAGNGGCAAILPELATWLAVTSATMSKDPRIGRVAIKRYGDVPLTMERNRVVVDAMRDKFDIVVMLDSDNLPDLYVNHRPWAKPFWDSSFAFAYERLQRGVPTVVCSPYCGPPPHPVHGGEENVFVFYAESRATDSANPSFRFEAYSRQQAARMRGIQECIAGPTGMILYTMSAFALMEFDRRPIPEILHDFKAGLMTVEQTQRALQMQSWFWYEFENQTQSKKVSTEDVTNTREIGMAGQLKFGEPVLFCNWDAWAGHMKPHCVGMPEPILVEQVSAVYQQAVLSGQHAGVEMHDVDFGTAADKREWASATHEQEAEESDVLPLDSGVDVAQTDPGNGHVEIKARLICGRKAVSVGHVTPDSHLEMLTTLARHMGTLKGGRPLRMLEVGSWVGESAIALLGGAPKRSELFCVDTWEGTPSDVTGAIAAIEPPFPWFLRNTEGLIGESVKPLKGDSVTVANSFAEPQELDLVFIDGDHTYDGCAADLRAWMRHVAPTGVICGHDYGVIQLPGVKAAVDEFAEEFGLIVGKVANTSIWFIGKAQSLTSGRSVVTQEDSQHGPTEPDHRWVASFTG